VERLVKAFEPLRIVGLGLNDELAFNIAVGTMRVKARFYAELGKYLGNSG